MIRTALYIRVSTEEQAIHGLSLEAQDAALTDYANKNDLTIVDRYIDDGITARKSMTKRTDLMRLLGDVRSGKVDLIIFTKLDRWFRNVGEYHKMQEILEKHNVHWKTIYESYDTSTAAGRLHINIMLSIAQDEADRTSERVKVVFANKVKNRKYPTNRVPFGYVVKDSIVYKDEENQHIAEHIFSKFFDLHSIRGTQEFIQNTYGIQFEATTFRKIFKNTLYCGEYRGVDGFCEPYITKAQFDEIQKIMAEKAIKKTPSGLDYVFTGLLVCGKCGRNLGSCYNTRGAGRSQKIATYRCNKFAKARTCDFDQVIMEKTIEEYLFKCVHSELDKYKEQYDLRVSEKKKQKKAGTTEKTVEKIKKKLSKLKDLYINDMIDIEEYKRDYDDLNKQIDDLTAEIEVEEEPIDIEAIKILLSKSTEEIYQTLTAENRRKFWRSFIDHIIVHSRDNMEIIFLRKDTY